MFTEKENKNIHVLFILDKSGSMQPIKKATISGVNEYVETLKKDDQNKYLFTLTLFDTDVQTPVIDKDIQKLTPLTASEYQPDGMTALYDAVVKTIKKLEERVVDERVLVVIMTDGEENSSTKYTQNDLSQLVEKLKDKKWTFVFLGANQDSWATAQAFGFSRGNTINFTASVKGMQSAMRSLANDTTMYAISMADVSKDFFNGKTEIKEENNT